MTDHDETATDPTAVPSINVDINDIVAAHRSEIGRLMGELLVANLVNQELDRRLREATETNVRMKP